MTPVKEIEEDGSPSREESAEDNENMIGGDLEDILIVQSNNQNNTESVINCKKNILPTFVISVDLNSRQKGQRKSTSTQSTGSIQVVYKLVQLKNKN